MSLCAERPLLTLARFYYVFDFLFFSVHNVIQYARLLSNPSTHTHSYKIHNKRLWPKNVFPSLPFCRCRFTVSVQVPVDVNRKDPSSRRTTMAPSLNIWLTPLFESAQHDTTQMGVCVFEAHIRIIFALLKCGSE